MSTRPSRAMSIPTTTLPPIDNVISMPFTASPLPLPRPRLPPTALSSPPAPNALPPSNRAGPPYAIPRSRTPLSTLHAAPGQPRVIGRNATSATSSSPATWGDVACSPPTIQRSRRPSASASLGGPASLSFRPPAGHSSRSTSNSHWHPHAPTAAAAAALPQPFPRPSYLEHSSLRELLQTELPPHLHQQLVPPPAPLSHPPASPVNSRLRSPSTDSDDDRSPSPIPPILHTPPRSQTMIGSNPVFRLPTRWSEQDRHAYLSVSSDGRELTYNGANFASNQNIDPGLARANHPIPSACGIYYYEIEVLSKNQKAQVSIGFTAGMTRLNKLPGWEKESWGYHGDDGYSYASEKSGQPYGPTFGSGDTIGAGIDFSQNRAFFTKNGALIAHVFDNVGTSFDQPLYPAVGLRHTQEHIRVNFGHAPFRYDIDEHVLAQRDAVWAQTQRCPLDARRYAPPSEGAQTDVKMDEGTSAWASGGTHAEGDELGERSRDAIGKLVLGYLVHHGYAKTAAAFEQQLTREPDSPPALPVPAPAGAVSNMLLDEHDLEHEPVSYATPKSSPKLPAQMPTTSLERRLALLNAITEGDIDTALEHAEAWFPAVLDAHDGRVRLKLRCRKFVELVNGAAATKRLVDARSTPATAGTTTAVAGVDVDGMDIDGDGEPDDEKNAAEQALRAAITYGQELRSEYRKNERREVQQLLDQAFSVVAYHFPSEVRGDVGRWAGRAGREMLAAEVNEVILESQGFPRQPALERAYRQTVATTVQLGYLGVGAAVFADVRRELVDV